MIRKLSKMFKKKKYMRFIFSLLYMQLKCLKVQRLHKDNEICHYYKLISFNYNDYQKVLYYSFILIFLNHMSFSTNLHLSLFSP